MKHYSTESLRVHISPRSSNEKTGPIPVTTTSAVTCPPACPFNNGGGCYASGGPLAMHWRAVTDGRRGEAWPDFLESLRGLLVKLGRRQLWRHNQAGDLPGQGDEIDRDALGALVAVNAYADARGFTYTHKPLLGDARRRNRRLIADCNKSGFTINASANGLGHADEIAAAAEAEGLRIPICSVVPADAPASGLTPAGRRFIVCPAQQREGVTCASCRLCSRADRSVIVAFRAHGAARRKAEKAIAR